MEDPSKTQNVYRWGLILTVKHYVFSDTHNCILQKPDALTTFSQSDYILYIAK